MAAMQLLRDRSGQFGILFGLLLLPMAGAAGLAVDYTKASNVRVQLKNEVDKIALAIAAGGAMPGDAAFLNDARRVLTDAFSFRDDLSGVTLSGEWVTISDYRVTASLDMDTSIGSVLNGGPLAISAATTARYKGAAYRYKVPQVAQLDPEAWDYNRISVYCFDARAAASSTTVGGGSGGTGGTSSGSGDTAAGRSQMTEIADNNGGRYNYKMPECRAGEALSLKLWNVREAKYYRENPEKSKRAKYTYYSDTVIENDIEEYDFGGLRIVETVVCDTLAQCKPRSKGGIIPEGKNRNPQISTKACAPGKFRYYGFEDRPPENGGSDRDYDDIRIIIECPEKILTGPETVRLIE